MMIVFWLIAALLLATALAFIVPPLVRKRIGRPDISHDQTNLAIYRDQIEELDADLKSGVISGEQHAEARTEIERRVLDDVDAQQAVRGKSDAYRKLAAGIAVAVPLLALPMYLFLGSPEAMNPETARAAGRQAGHEVTPEMINAMVEQLAVRLKANPDDPEGWMMLAKSYAVLGKAKEAAGAFAEASRLNPKDAQLLADYADALAVASGGLAGEPEKLIVKALEVDPRNIKALNLAGTVAYRAGDFRKAANHWRLILETVSPESELGQRISASIADAETKAGVRAPQRVAGGATANPASSLATAGAAIVGTVALSDSARRDVKPDNVVFVFARAPTGSRMPIAIQRVRVSDLPFKFRLDDAAAMGPGAKLSQSGEVVVGARVSLSGSAMPASGDWESELVPAKAGDAGLTLQIVRQVN